MFNGIDISESANEYYLYGGQQEPNYGSCPDPLFYFTSKPKWLELEDYSDKAYKLFFLKGDNKKVFVSYFPKALVKHDRYNHPFLHTKFLRQKLTGVKELERRFRKFP